jgi:hypothetical protein
MFLSPLLPVNWRRYRLRNLSKRLQGAVSIKHEQNARGEERKEEREEEEGGGRERREERKKREGKRGRGGGRERASTLSTASLQGSFPPI